jgi:hypothetical protein
MTTERKEAEELIREAFRAEMDRVEHPNRQEIVEQWSYAFLLKKFETEIYAEDVRRKAFRVLSKRLDSGDISDAILFRMIGTIGKESERVFLEIYKAVFSTSPTQAED